MGILLKQAFSNKTGKAGRTRGQLIYYFKKLHYSIPFVSERRNLIGVIASIL